MYKPVCLLNVKDAAAKSNAKLAPGKEATLSIKEFSARHAAARYFAGSLAGQDEIKAVIVYQGKIFPVQESYSGASLGISPLAKKVGEAALQTLKAASSP